MCTYACLMQKYQYASYCGILRHKDKLDVNPAIRRHILCLTQKIKQNSIFKSQQSGEIFTMNMVENRLVYIY